MISVNFAGGGYDASVSVARVVSHGGGVNAIALIGIIKKLLGRRIAAEVVVAIKLLQGLLDTRFGGQESVISVSIIASQRILAGRGAYKRETDDHKSADSDDHAQQYVAVFFTLFNHS